MTGHALVRIVFQLDSDAWHGSATERLWAEPVSGERFRLRNTPFYAFGVSAEDIVSCKRSNDEMVFGGVSLRGGHSTYRLRLKDRAHFPKYWNQLQALGCTYEEGPVFAVDVPPAADIYAVYKLLEEGETAGVWEFEEGHCGHPLHRASQT